jgi:hypothetical protein
MPRFCLVNAAGPLENFLQYLVSSGKYLSIVASSGRAAAAVRAAG